MLDTGKFVDPTKAFENALWQIDQQEIDELKRRVATEVDLQRDDPFRFELSGFFGAQVVQTMYRWLLFLDRAPDYLQADGRVLDPSDSAAFYAPDEKDLDPKVQTAVDNKFNSPQFQAILLEFLRNEVYANRFDVTKMRTKLRERIIH